MATTKHKYSPIANFLLILSLSILSGIAIPESSLAKSLYVNKDLNANSPISAYDIQAAPNYLVWQQTSSPTRYGGVGLAIDTDSEVLFVTFENSGILDIVDAKTLAILGQVAAPNASNLAGIVVDQEKQKVYAVDRGTNHLYVYSWDAVNKTLSNDIGTWPNYVPLNGIAGYGAYGIALDEPKNLLYVADVSNQVKVFNTSDWSTAGTVAVSAQPAMGVALDVKNQLLYTGNATNYYGGNGKLVQTDLQTGAGSSVNIQTLPGGVSYDFVVGLAVDPATSLVYITTGDQYGSGSDRILVFDSGLNLLHATGDIGNPTGIVVPGKEISYNPLNLSKDDRLAAGVCAPTGALTYDICFDNLGNSSDVTEVTIVDTLPAEAAYVSSSGGGSYDAATHSVTWTVGTLPAGTEKQCVQVTVSVAGGAAGKTVTNACTIDSKETPPTTQNESTEFCSNQPPVAVIGGSTVVDEGSKAILDASGSSDPDDTIASYAWDLDNDGSYDDATGISAEMTKYDNGTFTVGLQVTDTYGAIGTVTSSITWNNVAPVVSALTAPALVPVNTAFSVNASIVDPGTDDTHIDALCSFGNGGASHVGDVDQLADKVKASSADTLHTDYALPGVYTVTMTVKDDDGAAGSASIQVVAYDPNAGFVIGGGWIDSPAGAYKADASLAGKANFGFVSKYLKGATTPSGQTEFNFQTASLNFHSSSYDWLVVNNGGANAQYKGSGTINGSGNYRFMLWAGDSAPDTFRIRIWEEDGVGTETVVYDNAVNQPIGGGSIVIQVKPNK